MSNNDSRVKDLISKLKDKKKSLGTKPKKALETNALFKYSDGKVLNINTIENNYQRRRIHRFPAVTASKIKVVITATNGDQSARIYEIRAYNE